MHSSALKVLGPLHREQQEWFDENDEEIKALLAEKHRLHRAHQNDSSSTAKKNAFNTVLILAGIFDLVLVFILRRKCLIVLVTF